MSQLDFIAKVLNEREERLCALSREIWGYAEMAYEEERSAEALQKLLKEEGFSVVRGLVNIPTAFTATFRSGSGKPVAAILGEYDALAELSQEAGTPLRKPVRSGAPGHGCGHNLLGVGGAAAAIAVKEYLQAEGKDGTVVYFGCPAEEGAGSKQFLARAGYFDGVDFCYAWHPSTVNEVPSVGNVAIMGANFTFDGVASHAGSAPHLGRSALDAAELMNVGVNYLREHMPDQARIHYAYSDAGGAQPNVVPAHAAVKYEVRAPKVAEMKDLFERVVNVARGAALMTDTHMEYEVTMAFSDYLPSRTLAPLADKCLRETGAPQWTEEEYRLAADFLETYPETVQKAVAAQAEAVYGNRAKAAMLKPLDSEVHPYDPARTGYSSGSRDVGDVGYATPTVNIHVATACFGNVNHSWQNTAQAGSSIGEKGMMTAAKALALMTVRTMEDPELIAEAKEELLEKNGGKYVCPLPETVKPPIGKY